MADDRRHYILRIENLNGEVVQRDHFHPTDHLDVETADCAFAVIDVTKAGAEIIDDGYTSWEEARKAWPDAI
jgi:hypothetical protein